MEELRAKHRKELRDLQGKITQKKKSATKKTRKGVNDECETLERELKEKHEQEIAALNGDSPENGHVESQELGEPESSDPAPTELTESVKALTIDPKQAQDELADQKTKKPNRQKARLARRAAEQAALSEQAANEAASLPDLREQERKRMLEHFSKHGLKEKEIRADGHCLYSAVADQMQDLGLGLKPKIGIQTLPAGENLENTTQEPDYKVVRAAAADYIDANADDFAPFLEEPLASYSYKVRDTGEWGGHMELMALAKTYGVHINVLHGDGRVDKIDSGAEDDDRTIWLGYYRHGFGLGEHYNSLRRAAEATSESNSKRVGD